MEKPVFTQRSVIALDSRYLAEDEVCLSIRAIKEAIENILRVFGGDIVLVPGLDYQAEKMWNQDDFGNEMAVVRGLQSFLHNVIAAASSAAGEFRIVEMDKETGVLVDGKRKGSKKLADAEAIRDFLPSEKSNYDSAFPDGFEKGAKRVSDLFGKKLVLAGVGGGVPKVKSGTELLDVEIDKPLGVWRTAAMIASEVEADVFAILTDMKPFFENPNGSDVCSMMELNVRDVRSFINDRSLGVLTDRFLAAVHYLDFYPKGLVLMSDLHDLPKIARGDFCSTVLVNR